MPNNQSNLFIIKNGKHVHMTPDQLFDKYRFNQIRLITYSISKTFILRYLSKYQYIHITAGIKPHTKAQLKKDFNTLKSVFDMLKKIHSWHHSANDLLVNDKYYLLRIPHNVHSKIYLLSNNRTANTRIIEGSANLSFAGMGIGSNQNEDLTVYDNNPKIFKQYLANYNQINKDSFIWTNDLKKDKQNYLTYNPKVNQNNHKSRTQKPNSAIISSLSKFLAPSDNSNINSDTNVADTFNKKDIQNLKAHLKSANCSLLMGKYKKSIKILNDKPIDKDYYCITIYHGFPKELCMQYNKILSKDYLAIHHFLKASSYLNNIITHSTDGTTKCQALFDKARCDQKLTNFRDYKDDLLKSLKLNQYQSKARTANIFNRLNDIAVKENDNESAIKYLKQAVALDKNNKLYNFKLGKWYQHNQNIAEAIHYLSNSYLHSADINLRLGDLYSVRSKQSKLLNKAIEYYIKGLSCINAKEISLTEAKAKCCQRLHLLIIAKQLYSNVVNDINTVTTDKHVKAKNIIASIKISLKIKHEELGDNSLQEPTPSPFSHDDSYKNICNVEQAIILEPTNAKYYNYLSKLEERYGLSNQSILSERIATLLNPDELNYRARLFQLRNKYQDKNINSNTNAESRLNNLIGLHSVKKSIKTIINRALIDKIRNHTKQHQQLHLVFEGNAGTGKTTIAKLLCHILYDKHVIPKNNYVETSGTALIKSHYGESANLIRSMIHKAIGGVLFIDEAYHLGVREDGNDACQDEVVDELVNDIEDHKHDIVVIMAGYTKPMEHFINHSNQGLSSRFPKEDRIIFPDYSALECWKILLLDMKQNNMIINKNAVSILHDYINNYVNKNTGHGFGNARAIRNIFSALMDCFANRVSNHLSKHNIALLKDRKVPDKITIEDVTNLIQH